MGFLQYMCPHELTGFILFADLLTVSETANEPPQDEGNSFNSPRNLAMEATYINHNFSQQCLRMVSMVDCADAACVMGRWRVSFLLRSGLVPS